MNSTPEYQKNPLKAGRSSLLHIFFTLRNLPDCARLEMLETDFRREIPRSGSFAGVRVAPSNGSRVFIHDFGK